MNRTIKTVALISAMTALSACSNNIIGFGGLGAFADARTPDKTLDRGRDAKDLSQLVAGVWIDPNGCQHWIIDDGVEGYMSQRVDPYGKPICAGHGAETLVTGPFKSGSDVPDLSNAR